MSIKGLVIALILLVSTSVSTTAQALTPEQQRAIAAGETDERIAALNHAVATNEPGLAPFVQALLDDAIKLTPAKVIDTRVPGAVVPEGAEDVVNNNRMRAALQGALQLLGLASPEADKRRAALDGLAGQTMDEAQATLVDAALARETEPVLKKRLALLSATLTISSNDRTRRLQAAKVLSEAGDANVQGLLIERIAVESDAEVKGSLQSSLSALQRRLDWGERAGALFAGLSLGSILLLAALGLAISYGLMGVINMAHGELMMVGAYATYLVQNAVRAWLPAGFFDLYIVIAIPVAFISAALVGAALERSVIRYLYGRPLETLLATWGISLVLQQGARTIFGAQNVPVENPSWLSGGWEVMGNLTLPWNRIAIIVFAGLVLAGVALLIARTRLGLFVRGVTQNRVTAACMGVNTARIDCYAFSLGAGLAGLAGCALSQVGNVGPDLGQGYIVDSFMVVVLGGVGQLAGTVYAAMGLGLLNKLIEGWAGAVLAKIFVLAFIVVFIQKRPQGLFAMKGRSAES